MSIPQWIEDLAWDEWWERAPANGRGGHNRWERTMEDGERQQLDFWTNTWTCTTTLNHPYKRSNQYNTQLHRQIQTWEMLADVFSNPRVHTGQGYGWKANKPSYQGVAYGGW